MQGVEIKENRQWVDGAGGGTGTGLRPANFKSPASAIFATPAPFARSIQVSHPPSASTGTRSLEAAVVLRSVSGVHAVEDNLRFRQPGTNPPRGLPVPASLTSHLVRNYPWQATPRRQPSEIFSICSRSLIAWSAIRLCSSSPHSSSLIAFSTLGLDCSIR